MSSPYSTSKWSSALSPWYPTLGNGRQQSKGFFSFSERASSNVRSDFQVAEKVCEMHKGWCPSVRELRTRDHKAEFQLCSPHKLWLKDTVTAQAWKENPSPQNEAVWFLDPPLSVGLSQRRVPGGGAIKSQCVLAPEPLLAWMCWKSQMEMSECWCHCSTIALEAAQLSLGRPFLAGASLSFVSWLEVYEQREVKMATESLTSQRVR